MVASATLVAVTVAVEAELTFGAVNMPLLEIVPELALQVTAVFEVLLTVATNCWCAPRNQARRDWGDRDCHHRSRVHVDGDIGNVFVGSATLVAVTVAVEALVTLGAVNNPLLEIVPPCAVQVTLVFEAFVTCAENCSVPADATLPLLGVTVTPTTGAPLPVATVMYTVTSPMSVFGRSEITTRKL